MSPVPVAIVPVAIAPGPGHETSNAITALQEWSPSLALKGAMVTIDAMGRPESLLPAPRGLESLSRRCDQVAISRIWEI
jgi:hypothetical protein